MNIKHTLLAVCLIGISYAFAQPATPDTRTGEQILKQALIKTAVLSGGTLTLTTKEPCLVSTSPPTLHPNMPSNAVEAYKQIAERRDELSAEPSTRQIRFEISHLTDLMVTVSRFPTKTGEPITMNQITEKITLLSDLQYLEIERNPDGKTFLITEKRGDEFSGVTTTTKKNVSISGETITDAP